MKKTNKKGFTLAELLVVVAIIAVLVAIAIPIFTAQLEKARESTDAANLRAAYAEAAVKSLNNDGAAAESDPVELTQTVAKWAYVEKIADVATKDADGNDAIPSSGKVKCVISTSGAVSFVAVS